MHVAVVAPPELVDELLAAALRRLVHLERCWSAFIEQSDVSRLNRAGGRFVAVDRSTIVLVGAMAAGVRMTAGAFDPSLLGGVVGIGPPAAWSRPADVDASSAENADARSSWADGTVVDIEASRIRIPAGTHLDAGAIGKGLAADLVSGELLGAGASGVRVVVGGDLRVVMPTTVEVNGPSWDGGLGRIAIADGGVATSGTGPHDAGRRGGPVLDPRTRRALARPSGAGTVQVTVAARTAAEAEVLATALLVEGGDIAGLDLDACGVGVLTVRADGATTANSSWRALQRGADTGAAS